MLSPIFVIFGDIILNFVTICFASLPDTGNPAQAVPNPALRNPKVPALTTHENPHPFGWGFR